MNKSNNFKEIGEKPEFLLHLLIHILIHITYSEIMTLKSFNLMFQISTQFRVLVITFLNCIENNFLSTSMQNVDQNLEK